MLNFDLYTTILSRAREAELIFDLSLAELDRKFEFKCEKKEEYYAWVKAIADHILGSEGQKQIRLAPSLKEFWRHEQITEEQFLHKADTFDILLFRCNSSGGKIIRGYTGSEYDHTAMVLRFDSDKGDN